MRHHLNKLTINKLAMNKLAIAVGAVATLALPVQTIAQTTGTSANILEEIVVTARRRDESMQDVPISITAVSGDFIERIKVGGTDDLQFLVPSLAMIPSGSMKETLAPSLRGQRNQDVLGTMDASVATYFGDTLVARASGLNQALYDLSQVQVLKGVQGTLFGRNTTGGAIVLQPQAPTDEFEGNVSVGFGNYNNQEVTAVLNVPFTDTLAMRVAGKVQQRDGFAENIETGQELEDRDLKSWRISLRWNPTDNIESLTIYDHYEHDQGGTLSTIRAINPSASAIAGHQGLGAAAPQLPFFPNLAGAFPDLNALVAEQRARSNPRKFRSQEGTGRVNGDFFGKLKSEVENWGLQNTTSVDVGAFTIKNMMGYRESYLDTVTDMDGSIAGLITPNQGNDYEFFSNELQFLGTALEEKLDWVAGLYYMTEEGGDWGNSNQFNELTVEGTRVGTFSALMGMGFAFPDAVAAANGAASAASKIINTTGEAENESRAAYVGLTYRLNSTWTLSGGLRYTEDERTYTANSNTFFFNTGVNTCDFIRNGANLPIDECGVKASKTFDAFTYDATLTYNFSDDSMVYGSFRHGYRSGGFGGRARNDAEMKPFDPEEVDEFEVGFKSEVQMGNVPARFNGAFFFQDYTDIQRQTPIDVPGGGIATIIENAAEGEIWGGELELQIMPTENISVAMFYSYTDGEYGSFMGTNGVDRSNEWLILAPKNTIGATVSYMQDLADMGGLTWTLNLYSQSSGYIYPTNEQIAEHGGYSLVNARVDWENVAGSSFDIGLWGRNLGDKDARVGSVGIVNTGAGFGSALWNDPRTYGVDVRYRF